MCSSRCLFRIFPPSFQSFLILRFLLIPLCSSLRFKRFKFEVPGEVSGEVNISAGVLCYVEYKHVGGAEVDVEKLVKSASNTFGLGLGLGLGLELWLRTRHLSIRRRLLRP